MHGRKASGSGFSLVELAISIGVLAVAVPLAFAAMSEAGRSGMESAQDNRSASIVQACLHAVGRARDGEPGWFEATPVGVPFPAEGEMWVLAFAADGCLLGRATREQHGQGLRRMGGGEARYLASCYASAPQGSGSSESLLRLTIIIEHPASQPAELRKRTFFHSSIR